MKDGRWLHGMGAFLVVWPEQFVSTIGTLMTSLALAFWAFDTGKADRNALPEEAMR